MPVAHLYARISHPDQRKGGGIDRQTGGGATEFCRIHGFTLSKRVWVDDGVSAFKGVNASPDHELGKFFAEVRRGRIPAGDCLLVENYDRISRAGPWAGTSLINGLREMGIHVGRLDRMKLMRSDSEDVGDFFEANLEFMRGNSESSIKSLRNGAAWERKRDGARKGKPLTRRLPSWVECVDGKLQLIPERAAVLVRVFEMADRGWGAARIVKQLTEEGVPAFGACVKLDGRRQAAPGRRLGAGHWTRAYIGLLLKDERVLGKFQPRRRDGTPDGEAIEDYYPRVIDDGLWYRVRQVREKRRPDNLGTRGGSHAELFTGLIVNARDGGSYYAATRTENGKHSRVLINTAAAEGRGKCYSFPLPTFESAILSLFREIDPHEILNGDSGPDDSMVLAGELAGVEGRIATLEAELLTGDVAAAMKVLRVLESKKADLAARLAEARQKAAHPLSESWGETQSLLDALGSAPDPAEARLRLRASLRRIIESIHVLVVPRGRTRLCACQVFFAEHGRRRDYLILHTAAKANGASRTEGTWLARSLPPEVAGGLRLDLRDRKHAERLEKALAAVDLDTLFA
jgi:DNA invertase Pin-like site-specific DNA recombinase